MEMTNDLVWVKASSWLNPLLECPGPECASQSRILTQNINISMVLISIMKIKVLTTQLLSQQFLFLQLHSYICPSPPKNVLAKEYKYLKSKCNAQVQDMQDLRSICLSFHGMHEKESIYEELDQQRQQIRRKLLHILSDNAGQPCVFHIHLNTKNLILFRQLKILNT